MKRFTDRKGRTWDIDLTLPILRRIKDLLNLDFLSPISGAVTSDDTPDVFRQVHHDVALKVDVLCLSVQATATNDAVTDEDFGTGLDEESINNGMEAWMEEYINFFHPEKRKILQQVMAKMTAKLEERKAANPVTDQMVDDMVQEALTRLIPGN